MRKNSNQWLEEDIINQCCSKDHQVKIRKGKNYHCTYYKIKMNMLSFLGSGFYLPLTMIAPPASVDAVGFTGDIVEMIEDFSGEKGSYLILNLHKQQLDLLPQGISYGKTLPSCIFYNDFSTFEDYLISLRSSYRRRVKQALTRSQQVKVKTINPSDFNEQLYNLYLNVLEKSSYKLETLPLEFFRNHRLQIDVFTLEDMPIAFVSTYRDTEELDFIFGGMDYSYLKKYDLYFKMLLFIIDLAIKENCPRINLGQTAVYAKTFLGAKLEERYIAFFSCNKLMNFIVGKSAHLLENSQQYPQTKPFKDGGD